MPNNADRESAGTKRRKVARASKQRIPKDLNQNTSADEPNDQISEPNQSDLFPLLAHDQDRSKTPKDRHSKAPKAQDKPLNSSAREYKELCQLAHKIKQLKPWQFMEETDVFGVQDPDTGEVGFVSVMGELGEFEALAVYLGTQGLYAWKAFAQELERNPHPEQAFDMIFEIPQLQLAFSPASLLAKTDREVIKHSGLKFSGTRPSFRSHRPGYMPWYLTQPEARQLIHALTQAIDVAKRFEYDANVIPFQEVPEDREYLIRVPEMRDSKLVWQDQIQTVNPPATTLVPFSVDDSVLKGVRALPKSGPLEVDLFTVPVKVGRRGERPRVMYTLLAVDAESGFVLGVEAMEALDGIDLLWASVPEKFAEMLLASALGVPAEIRARSKRLSELLDPLVTDLEADLWLVEELPALDEAKAFLFKSMSLVS